MGRTSRIEERAYEAIKGVLILIVILDHNDILREPRSVQELFLPITFHVGGFLLLPFLGTPHGLSFQFAGERAARYLIPFALATIGYAVLFHLVVASGAGWGQDVWTLVLALGFGTPATLKAATGFIVLWFPPALFSLVIAYAAVTAAPRWLAAGVIALACGVHLVVGLAPPRLDQWTPMNVTIALFMLPLGLLLRQLHQRLMAIGYPRMIGVGALALLAACWAFEYGRESEVATLRLPSVLQLHHLLAIDVSILACVVALLTFRSALARIPLLTLLGRHSLVVYIVHPLAYRVVLPMTAALLPGAGLTDTAGIARYAAAVVGSVAVTTGLSLLAALALEQSRFASTLLMPRRWAEWPPVRFVRR